MSGPQEVSQDKRRFRYRKCKPCSGTGYTAKERDNPILAGVCRACQGTGVIGGKIRPKHVPQYAH